uniref:DNA polymerase II subunit 2 n=1 Tax=Meloidogyne enterolobii TaxID=390850 RepID=A0A6V7TRN5_MELEN|nr:unnamed protein product [Meloidogyne enterolobii]
MSFANSIPSIIPSSSTLTSPIITTCENINETSSPYKQDNQQQQQNNLNQTRSSGTSPTSVGTPKENSGTGKQPPSKSYCILTPCSNSHPFEERRTLDKLFACWLLIKNQSTEDDVFVSIDSIFNLCGSKICILAQLCRGDGAWFVAEDQTARIKLDLTEATYEPGIYFEGGIFVFEGICSLTTLKVEKVSLPKLTGINSEENTSQRQDVRFSRRRDPNDRICIFSDLLLDNDKVLKAFYRILDGFSSNPPNIFVLCGRFLSVQRAYGYTDQSITAFRHLANILSHFSTIYLNLHFILVPHQEDPPPLITFPCPLYPQVYKNVSKICQIYILLLTRVEKICRSAIHMPKDVQAEMIPKLFCDTMWSQRHLSPLPLFYNSIQPETDKLFHLWPEPDVLLLADKFKGFIEEETSQRRLTINPGPFLAENFEFQVYFPTLGRVDNSVFVLDDN